MSGSVANSHRKYNPDPLMPVSLKLRESLIHAIDTWRGQQTRTAYITDAIHHEISLEPGFPVRCGFEALRDEAERFFEWPTDDRSTVSLTSCILFARHIAAMAEKVEA